MAELELLDRRFKKTPYVPKKKDKICTICKCREIPKGPIRGCVLTRMCEYCWSNGETVFEEECTVMIPC